MGQGEEGAVAQWKEVGPASLPPTSEAEGV